MRQCLTLIMLACCPLAAMAQGIGPSGVAPMKWIEQCMPENLPALKFPEYADLLDKARGQMQAGRYRLALQTVRLARPADARQRVEVEAQVLFHLGRFDESLKMLSAPDAPLTPSALRLRSQVLAQLGKHDDAVGLLQTLIASGDNSPLTHTLLANTFEQTGQLSKARAALAFFSQQQYARRWQENQLDGIESADDLVAIATGLNRLAILGGLYRTNSELHDTILGMYVKAYDVLDRRNADAHAQAAGFFMAHDDAEHAKEELYAALKLNPNHIEALSLLGRLSLSEYDFSACEKAIAAIGTINDEHPAGALLTARLLLMERLPDEAQHTLEPVLHQDPRNLEALALLATCDALRFDSKALDARLKSIDAIMPESSEAYVTAASLLATAFQFNDAMRLLNIAIERTPHWNEPRNLLSMALMEQSDVNKARPVLEEAHSLDPYNVITTNYLRLLDSLGTYQIRRSPHFAVRFDPAFDPFIGQEVLSYMEENYPRICSMYGYEPPEPTMIELMPTSEDFAVRTTGKSFIPTIGASTGPVITMVAPRRFGKTNGAFDWCDVTRHEFTHTVTLGATNLRMPRWFTEGLAVSEQVCPMPYDQFTLLAGAVEHGKLFSVRRINWSFIRPRKPQDRMLAYAQSYWICVYLHETFGHAAILNLQQAYHDGMQTEAAISKSLGISSADLDTRFAAWAAGRVAASGMDKASQEKLVTVKKQGEEQLKAQDIVHARDTWEKAYALCPMDPVVHQRLAGLYLYKTINQPEKALPHLHALDAEQLKDNRYAMRLSRLYVQLKRPADAVRCARRATQIDPYDPAAREVLADALTQAGDTAGAQHQRDIIALIAKSKSAAGKAAPPAGPKAID